MERVKIHKFTLRTPVSRRLPYILEVAFTCDGVDHIICAVDDNEEGVFVKAICGFAMVTVIPFDRSLEILREFNAGDSPFDMGFTWPDDVDPDGSKDG